VCLGAATPDANVEGQPLDRIEEKQIDKSTVVAWIDTQLETIRMFQDYVPEHNKLHEDAEARTFSLPPAEATDKLLRYETHFDRQLYRAMDQLERMQRQRRGENVPPPLNVNLGRRTY
jgi:hypothetical protein